MAAQPDWFSPGLRFTCTQCGSCCSGPPGYVWFTDQEAAAMARHVGLSIEDFRGRYAQPYDGQWSLKDSLTPHGYDCVFLQRDASGKATCSIYEVRPRQCRTWPFWTGNLRRRADWEHASARCPGMAVGLEGQGTFYPLEQIRIIRDGG